jgi:hypothetical protein
MSGTTTSQNRSTEQPDPTQLYKLAVKLVKQFDGQKLGISAIETEIETVHNIPREINVQKTDKKGQPITGEFEAKPNQTFIGLLTMVKGHAKLVNADLNAPRGRDPTWSILDDGMESNQLRATSVIPNFPTGLESVKVGDIVEFTVTVKAKKVEKKTTKED